MSENDEAAGRKLRKAEDFRAELEGGRDEADVRRELGLPEVDDILKDLQREHGIRVSLSPKLVKRFESVKASADDPTTLGFGCQTQDICIFCDSEDRCNTCDAMDWCISVDTHIADE